MEWWKILLCVVLYLGIGCLVLIIGSKQYKRYYKALENRFWAGAGLDFDEAITVYTCKSKAELYILVALELMVWIILLPFGETRMIRAFRKEWKSNEKIEELEYKWTKEHVKGTYLEE